MTAMTSDPARPRAALLLAPALALAAALAPPEARAQVVPVPGADHGLGVPSTRSGDGQRHEGAQVVPGLAGDIAQWLRRLGREEYRIL